MTVFSDNVALALYAVLIAGIVALLAAQAARSPLARRLRASWRGLGVGARAAVVAALACGVAIGGSKTNDPPLRVIGGGVSSLNEMLRSALGALHMPISLVEARTNDVAITTPTTNAAVSQLLLKRGTSEGGEWLEFGEPVLLGTSSFARVYASPAVLSFGSMRHPGIDATLPDGTGATNLVALRMPLGMAPEANRGRLSAPSRFWHEPTRSGHLFSWDGLLLDRMDDAPATIQVEALPGGDFAFRYDFSRAAPTNGFYVGAQAGAAAVEAMSVRGGATNGATVFRIDGEPVPQGVPLADVFAHSQVFELLWRNTAGLGDLSGDTDGDGLGDAEELALYGTDPHQADTDGDGLEDGAEVAGCTNPLDPDTDGNGIPDGWTAAAYAAHPLWATNSAMADMTIRFADGETSARGVFRVDNLPILLSGTNAACLTIAEGTMHDFAFVTSDGLAHSLSCTFRAPIRMRGGDAEDYGWFTDDPVNALGGAPIERGTGRFAKATVSLHTGEEPFNCIHDDSCTITVAMEPDIWNDVKDAAEIVGGTLQPNGTILVEDLCEPGECRNVLVALDGPMFSFGVVGAETTVHRCESLVSSLCPICHTPHGVGAPCDHGGGCALATNGLHCSCPPVIVPLNADDDDNDGTEDRHGSGRAFGEDDLVAFGAGTIANTGCCCRRFQYKVRFTSIPSSVRVWKGDSLVSTGAAVDGGMFAIEGVVSSPSDQGERLAYQILDAEEAPVATNDWNVAVRPEVTVAFSAGDIYGGDAVVVKRSTDPVRTNNATCLIHAEGYADGRYRLHTDKGRFDYNGMQDLDVELVDGECSAELYGYTPSATTNDATIALQSVEGNTFASTNYTVLWVEISMRCGQDDPFSADNGMLAYSQQNLLGSQIHYGFVLASNVPNSARTVGNIVEFCGLVHPPDFLNAISMARDNVDEIRYYFTTNRTLTLTRNLNRPCGTECVGNDPSSPFFQDSDPSPNGVVYDIDTPGFILDEIFTYPSGIFFHISQNFFQYAHFGGKRCSDNFRWFSRTTTTMAIVDGMDELCFCSFPVDGLDNSCGQGQSPTYYPYTEVW